MRNAYAVHRTVVNSFLVRERDRKRLRELMSVVLIILPLAVALLATIWIHLEVLGVGYRIDALEDRLDLVSRGEQQLRLEAAYLASPDRIERLAIEELGMRAPSLDSLVFAEELEP